MGRKLRQAGFLGTGVVGEDRILARGAGGAAGVGVTLVQRHRQLQILLKLQTGVNFDLRPTDRLRGRKPTHLVGRHGQTAIQILHQLFEGGSLRGNGIPAVPHHHVPETEPGGVTTRIQNPQTSETTQHYRSNILPASYSSWVHVEGLSMR